jgi:hypothetical protein
MTLWQFSDSTGRLLWSWAPSPWTSRPRRVRTVVQIVSSVESTLTISTLILVLMMRPISRLLNLLMPLMNLRNRFTCIDWFIWPDWLWWWWGQYHVDVLILITISSDASLVLTMWAVWCKMVQTARSPSLGLHQVIPYRLEINLI